MRQMESQQPAENPRPARFGISYKNWRKLDLWNTKMLKYFFCISIPFALLPLAVSRHKEARCGYVILWMAIYWILEPVNISVTALLPVLLYPLLGISNSDEITQCYMKESLMFFIGSLGVAIAVEHCNLHERIALLVLLKIGADTVWLLLGFMSTSMFLSLWINNSATTAMMVPVIDALIEKLKSKAVENTDENNKSEKTEYYKVLHKTLLLSVAYASSLGGTGTLAGTPPNMLFKAYIEDTYPESGEVTYASWIAYNIPGMIVCTIATWLILQAIYLPCWRKADEANKRKFPFLAHRDWKKADEENTRKMMSVIQSRYNELGSISFHEICVLVLFLLLVLLWVSREPKIFPGWGNVVGSGKKVGDVVPAIGVLFLLFILPARFPKGPKSPPLLEWKVFLKKMPWGLVLLIGGGYAMAKGSEDSRLSVWIGKQLIHLHVFPNSIVLVFVFLLTSVLTEVLSNAACVTIFLPVVDQMAQSLKVNPLYLLLPMTIGASHAFMLPAGTGSNAIIYKTGHVKTLDMVKSGFFVKIVAFLVQIITIHSLGEHLFEFEEFPKWAINATLTANSTLVAEQ